MKYQRGRPPKTRLPDGDVKVAFEANTITLRLEQIAALKVITPAMRKGEKFKQVVTSIRKMGIIEMPVVAPASKAAGTYMLLDGHLRLEALKEIGEQEVTCLLSTDDESFTYNKHTNRISTIQEHRMIQKAVKRVPPAKLAEVLNLDVGSILRKRNLTDGICAEAIELLKDKMVAAEVFTILKRMKPYRQIEAAGLMISARTYSISYAKAILVATANEQLVNPGKPKNVKGLDVEQIARMEGEMATLEREYKLVEESYARDIFNLTLARNYLITLLGNARVVRYLAQHQPEILTQFQRITDMKVLGKNTA